MREVVFTIEYERGADPLMDVFIESPDLYARSMQVQATSEAVWGIEKLVGTPSVLDEYDERLERVAQESSLAGMCGAPVTEYRYEMLSSNPESRKIYSLQREGDGPRSLPIAAANHLGEGVIMRSERHGDQFRWHLLVDGSLGTLHDDVRANLRDGLSLTVERLGEPPCLLEDGRTQHDLTTAQKTALEAALTRGYYEEPRKASVSEIAEEIDVPSSTLQYRLNRAEAWLAEQFAADSMTVDIDTSLDLGDVEFIE
ncbi:helix-turn-helix domain-containing protein [Haloferax sulfurifontis]|uniref:Transcriptional regulator n=1 Tax=Haloferax sulfurifontis ATCC BAA-897 TaxID=662480 RepID=M0IAM8_9EURY|nr:helix-turn-helix domain-containing protein [Haloferax sulfurifontis]ELZ93077.1 transcriptional regulator [Haloferax sulfurifontis ATCC BAA-897]